MGVAGLLFGLIPVSGPAASREPNVLIADGLRAHSDFGLRIFLPERGCKRRHEIGGKPSAGECIWSELTLLPVLHQRTSFS